MQTINAVLVQAKVQHLNAYDILEVQLEIERTNCSIYHVESLETNLGQEIEERRQTHSPYEEEELRQVLLQTASALANAHSKSIAHREVKPDNIFRTANNYKLGDFGSFYMKRDTSVTKSAAGDRRYMSPQLREAYLLAPPTMPSRLCVCTGSLYPSHGDHSQITEEGSRQASKCIVLLYIAAEFAKKNAGVRRRPQAYYEGSLRSSFF